MFCTAFELENFDSLRSAAEALIDSYTLGYDKGKMAPNELGK